MLDPLSALSVAASALQFIDFSVNIISKSKEIYKSTSGALEEYSELTRSTKTLVHYKEKVRKALDVDSLRPPVVINDAQADLLELCDTCLKVGEKLTEQLTSLEVMDGGTHRRWKTVRQALKNEWGKKEVNKMRDSLSGYKSDLMLYILIAVQYVS
jgi:uncharacterized protein (UPF0264 family)